MAATKSGMGFQKNSPPKELVTNQTTLDLLSEMAKWANKPYCTSANSIGEDVEGVKAHAKKALIQDKEAVVVYFGGPKLSREQWNSRKFDCHHGMGISFAMDVGWKKSCDKMFNKFVLRLAELMRKSKWKQRGEGEFRIYLTGHGIGGVYAHTMAAYVREHLKTINFLTIITFGQPRWSDSSFAKRFNKDISNESKINFFRITNENDHVSQRPYGKTSYMHVGTEYWITYNCDCVDTPSAGNSNVFTSDGYQLFKCPGFFQNSKNNFGESEECNLGTDGSSDTAHDGPWFTTMFGKCRSLKRISAS
ncbi:hypothetical protein G9A89_001500 [Geosiphon pyriformis]|nr:hypothetical protein G9A89_001500 [Geosiphon pyriformis]